ncbi:peptidase domain-containing ABC transporter [Dyella jejuensis]|uniref:Peptidase domain-containing ABC transporter n=1 Tax=Dyella jejuensis TaxID=1432009 RepID=A0ABW8JE30_9GAMM
MRNVFSWRKDESAPLVMQTESTECALACLAMIASHFGYQSDLSGLRRRFNVSLKGVNLRRMVDIASSLGLETRARRADIDYLRICKKPCILHWDLNHFVVLGRATQKYYEILDPARGRVMMSPQEVSKHFTGVLVEFSKGVDFIEKSPEKQVPISALTGRIRGLGAVATQIIGIAFAIEIFSLALPLQLQWVMDQVLVSNDLGLLVAIAVGYLIVTMLMGGLGIVRAWLLSWLGATVSSQWITNLFSHLVRLPMDFFEKRHMGDVMSRFNSVQVIQTTLTSSFVEALLDGLMGGCALALLVLYSKAMTLIIVFCLSLYIAIRVVMYKKLWQVSEEQLVYTSRQQSELMESIRGMQAIKLGNGHVSRKDRLGRANDESARRTMLSQRITLSFSVISQSIINTQRVFLITLGAYLVINGSMSAGMLVAYLVLADQFSTRLGSFVDKVVDFKVLGLHLKRIADIALTPPESHALSTYVGPALNPSIRFENVSFRYAEGEPWVLRGLNLSIDCGESVAITGPSGHGKSTLVKLLVGLLEPTVGSITIGGIDIRRYGLERYRQMVGAVMQDDHLFAGSIADNVSLYDASSELSSIVAACQMAGIHEEILAMPMGYETLVGDMGSSLSGGQKQRLILARALYRKPSILVLDEATSHLDAQRERAINEAVAGIQVTRVIVAHRQETIASADRFVDIASLQSFTEESEPPAAKKAVVCA